MSNPIPPLVSSTPPPIDFDDNDDDFGGFESSDVTFNRSIDGKLLLYVVWKNYYFFF